MITLKAQFGNDIRRFSVDRNINFDKLKSLLNDIFQIEKMGIKYYDEESDLITLSSDLDFEEAKTIFQDSAILRLIISDLRDKHECSTSEKATPTLNYDDIIGVDMLKDLDTNSLQTFIDHTVNCIDTADKEEDIVSVIAEVKELPREKLVDICCKLSDSISSQSFISSDEILKICMEISKEIAKETEIASNQTMEMCKGLNKDYSSLSDEIKKECYDLSDNIKNVCLSTSDEISTMIRNI